MVGAKMAADVVFFQTSEVFWQIRNTAVDPTSVKKVFRCLLLFEGSVTFSRGRLSAGRVCATD